MTRAEELQAVSDAISSTVALKMYAGRLTPEEIERAAVCSDLRALASDVRRELGESVARDPWAFFAFGRPRGYARNLVLIYSRACELTGIVPAGVAS